MSLVTLKEVLASKDENRAIGAFNCFNIETVYSIISGAEAVKLPVIVAIGGPILRKKGNTNLARIAREMAADSQVPVALHLDHAKDYETCIMALRAGFSSIMVDGSSLSLDDNISLTNKVGQAARAVGASLEAELGAIPGVEDNEAIKQGAYTNLDQVKIFLDRVKVDALAVSIGNAHGLYKGEPKLDYQLLNTINRQTEIPLVLHGGTGLSDEQFARCIELGIKKINVGTEIRKTFVETFISKQRAAEDPNDLVGLLEECKTEVSKVIVNYLQFYRYGWKQYVSSGDVI